MKSNYLFFYLKTGNGHLAPAKALAQKISSNSDKNIATHLVDGLENAPSYIRMIIENGYRNSVNKAKWTFELLYLFHKIRIVSKITAFIISIFLFNNIEKSILSNKSDKIIIFHFFLIRPVLRVVKKHNLTIPVIIVVTDPFTAHPIWFLNKNQDYIVFSDTLKHNIIDNGITTEKQVRVFPFILDEQFSKPMTPTELISAKLELGFSLNTKILLILGGGEGIPNGKKILNELKSLNENIEISLVCGRNKKLFETATLIKEKYSLNNLKIYGYVDFVYKLIGISSLVITKCGASTFMEILMMKKIPIINSYIWEQELGNVEFVRKNVLGVFEKDIKKLSAVINKILFNQLLYENYLENITGKNLKNGTDTVANFILNHQ